MRDFLRYVGSLPEGVAETLRKATEQRNAARAINADRGMVEAALEQWGIEEAHCCEDCEGEAKE